MTFEPLAAPFAAPSVGGCSPQLSALRRLPQLRAFIAGCARRAVVANTLVMARWESNDGTKQLVAKQPVRLGALLNGDWTPNGYTLVEWSVAL